MAAPLLALRDIRLRYGATPIFDGADVTIADRDRLCLVGRNGAGKSTLMKIMAGLVEPDAGERSARAGARIAYLEQTPDLSAYGALCDYVLAALPADIRDLHRAEAALARFDLDPDKAPSGLSGGEARRAALAGVWGAEPDLLLLDEPTNHLDIPAIEALEAAIRAFPGAVVAISHDRRFLANVSRACLWIDRGAARRLNKGFAHFEAWAEDLLEKEAQAHHKLGRKIIAETRWLYEGGVTARRKRNMGRVRRLAEMRARVAERRTAPGAARLDMRAGDASGKLVIEADGVSKSVDTPAGARKLITDFSIRIHRGDRVGVIGPNGAGKTTLIRILLGELAPDSGAVRLGSNVAPIVIDQRRDALDGEATLIETLCPRGGDSVVVHGAQKHALAYLKDFLFTAEQARQPVRALSGGEQNRLLLAREFLRPGNLIVLDEPTNDLDMETLDLLQEQLADYDGTVLLVSHDRDFLDRTVSQTIAFEGDGRLTVYPGGYADVERQRGAASTAAQTTPQHAPAGKGRTEKTAQRKSRGKLSYKDQRRLDELSRLVPEMQARKEALETALADPELFQTDPAGFEKLSAELSALTDDLEANEEEWLTLEIQAEELQSTD